MNIGKITNAQFEKMKEGIQMSTQFIDIQQAEKALVEGKRVQFHWRGETTEINKETTLEDLRWNLKHKGAALKMTVKDIRNGKYSIIG